MSIVFFKKLKIFHKLLNNIIKYDIIKKERRNKMFTYKPLWKKLVDKDINKTQLQYKIKCSSATITTMGKNE